jgi:hypothetical protein
MHKLELSSSKESFMLFVLYLNPDVLACYASLSQILSCTLHFVIVLLLRLFGKEVISFKSA